MSINEFLALFLNRALKGGTYIRIPVPGLKPSRQMRRIHWQRPGAVRHPLHPRQTKGLVVYHPFVQQPAQKPVAPEPQFFRVGKRRYQPRRIRKNRQCGGLSPGQPFGRLAEIPMRSRAVAHNIAAIGRVIQIEIQDLFLVVMQLDLQCLEHLQGLVDIGPPLGRRHAGNLHRQRARAADDLPGTDILIDGPKQRQWIDAGMSVKTTVLETENRLLQGVRNIGVRLVGETPLLIPIQEYPQDPTLFVQHNRTVVRIEQRIRHGNRNVERAGKEQEHKKNPGLCPS